MTALRPTMSVGTLRLARDFADAAALLHQRRNGALSNTTYYLYGHSIELSLKAYLILNGMQDGDLRDIGHDLVKALEKSRAMGLESMAPLSPTHEESVQALVALNPYYSGKELEYLFVGFKSYPPVDSLSNLTHWLLENLDAAIRTRLSASKSPP